jgi:hypothetical protein
MSIRYDFYEKSCSKGWSRKTCPGVRWKKKQLVKCTHFTLLSTLEKGFQGVVEGEMM